LLVAAPQAASEREAKQTNIDVTVFFIAHPSWVMANFCEIPSPQISAVERKLARMSFLYQNFDWLANFWRVFLKIKKS
jgi:hypothetical protein